MQEFKIFFSKNNFWKWCIGILLGTFISWLPINMIMTVLKTVTNNQVTFQMLQFWHLIICFILLLLTFYFAIFHTKSAFTKGVGFAIVLLLLKQIGKFFSMGYIVEFICYIISSAIMLFIWYIQDKKDSNL